MEGDIGLFDKHAVFSIAVVHSKWDQSELIKNAWREFRYLFSENLNEFNGSCERGE